MAICQIKGARITNRQHLTGKLLGAQERGREVGRNGEYIGVHVHAVRAGSDSFGGWLGGWREVTMHAHTRGFST